MFPAADIASSLLSSVEDNLRPWTNLSEMTSGRIFQSS
jgi:hypothetical protein